MDFLSSGVKGLTPLIVLSRDEDIRSALLIFMLSFTLQFPSTSRRRHLPLASLSANRPSCRVLLMASPCLPCPGYFMGNPWQERKDCTSTLPLMTEISWSPVHCSLRRSRGGTRGCTPVRRITRLVQPLRKWLNWRYWVRTFAIARLNSHSRIIGHRFRRANIYLTQIAENVLKCFIIGNLLPNNWCLIEVNLSSVESIKPYPICERIWGNELQIPHVMRHNRGERFIQWYNRYNSTLLYPASNSFCSWTPKRILTLMNHSGWLSPWDLCVKLRQSLSMHFRCLQINVE